MHFITGYALLYNSHCSIRVLWEDKIYLRQVAIKNDKTQQVQHKTDSQLYLLNI